MAKKYIHREGPDSAPEDATFEVDSFGLGIGVTADEANVCDAVLVRQAVRLSEDCSVLVRTELPPAEARAVADRIVQMAEKVESKHVIVRNGV